MTHPNLQTNGASLEDCHTNFFALTELSGIKWRKWLWNETTGLGSGGGGPSGGGGGGGGEPLDDPLLRSYARCLATDILCVWRRVSAPRHLQHHGGVGGGGGDIFDHLGGMMTVAPPQPPPLSLCAAKELWIFWYGEEPDFTNLVAPELVSTDHEGSWETGLSYECRSLLFKALHNLIERCLLSRDFIRLGKWFVQPYEAPKSSSETSSTHLSFSFAFFVHGESTVCASVDVRQHPPVRKLSRCHLQQAQTSSTGLKVILAPFGLAGTLTGQSYNKTPEATARLLEDWAHFYPLDNNRNVANGDGGVVVEVIVGGIKMRYPACYVLVTDMDEEVAVGGVSGTTTATPTTPTSTANTSSSSNSNKNGSTTPLAVQTPPPSPVPINSRVPQPGPFSVSVEHPHSMQRDATAANVLPERVWQECVVGGAAGNSQQQQQQQECNWEFVDPTRRVGCTCSKCRKYLGNSGSSSATTSNSSNSSNSTKWSSNNSGLSGTKSTKERIGRRIPFHRRSPIPTTTTTVTTPAVAAATAPPPTTTTSSEQTTNQTDRCQPGSYTPQGGPPSYPRTQESTAIPSVGSPASAAPSPLPNPHSAQPASVPAADQVMPTLSPHPPTVAPSPLLDKIAMTPDQPLNSVASSPRNPCSSGGGGGGGGDVKCTSEGSTTQNSLPILKKPTLTSKEYESALEEEEQTLDLLYDFYTIDAWLNHPVKRFKPDSKEHQRNLRWNNSRNGDLYAMFTPGAGGGGGGGGADMGMGSDGKAGGIAGSGVNALQSFIKQEIKLEPGCMMETEPPILQTVYPHGVKRPGDPYEFDEEGAPNSACRMDGFKRGVGVTGSGVPVGVKEETSTKKGNLFTSEGLQPSIKDLDQIFDNSDDNTSSDEALQNQTPPGSNKSVGQYEGGDSGGKRLSGHGGCNVGILRPEELSKMFPTPPSMEHNPIASPCGGQTELPPPDLAELGVARVKQEIYPNMGSPQQEENIEDWSYVFKPPLICKMVGSSKYAPLTNLPSQSLPPVTLPTNCIYRPSWIQQQQQQQANNSEKSNNSTAAAPPPQQQETTTTRGGAAASTNPTPYPQSPMMHAAATTTPQGFRPPPPPYELPSPAPSSTASSYLNKNLNSVEAVATPPTNNSASATTVQMRTPPEANSLVLNVLLADTVFNIFRDHNFDSCTLCVCSTDSNIKGADAGVYLLAATGASSGADKMQRSNSPFPGMGQPPPPYGMLSPQHHLHTPLMDEDSVSCRCGFSAVVNRRLSFRSGLFYEDEMEITGVAEDPGERKKSSLLTYLLSSNLSKPDPTLDRDQVDPIPHTILELVREQCVIIQSSANALFRAARHLQRHTTTNTAPNHNTLNVLEFADSNDVTALALDQSKLITMDSLSMCKMEEAVQRQNSSGKRNAAVHRWSFLKASGPPSNQDIVRVMKSLQPLLQEAIQKKCQTRLWEAPSAVKGPLTWRQFHRLAGRGTDDRCEPQPIPSVVVGHEKDWLSLSPYALQHWESLLLEPYSYARDVAYVVVAPDNEAVLPRVRSFFKELSTAYEMCKLGRHSPITKVLRDGILRVGKKAKQKLANEPVEEWFTLLGDGEVTDMLRLYAQVCKHHLAPHLQQVPMDKTLLDPPESQDKPAPSPMPPPSTPDNSQSSMPGDKAPSTPKNEQASDSESSRDVQSTMSTAMDTSHDDDEREAPSVIVYLVEPFSMGSDQPELQRLACLALLRCYQSLLSALPESMRSNVSVQIISQESIMELGKARERNRHSDHMRALALSIFSQCRRLLMHTNNVKSLTGFGTAAMADLFLKSKDDKNRAPYKLYTPPYILAPLRDKIESAENFGRSRNEHVSVLYLSYCLSADQSWLLAVATDERGEIFETVTINIDIPNRSRRKKASARRMGLQKLMDFILSVMSQSVRPWRLVVGRLGRIGHGELKSWNWLLSKKHLVKTSQHLKELCQQCSLMYPNNVPCILSACLVSLEADSALRLMPDQFTPDERFSQASVNSQLSTPHDVTCTHILVFPTSATSQSQQMAFQEQQQEPDLETDDLFFNEEINEDIAGMSITEILDWTETGMGVGEGANGSPRREDAGLGSPNCGTVPGRQGSPYQGRANSRTGGDAPEEMGVLLQQPLALGYMVSTAPTGRMPSWFWTSCPHLEGVCPAFLKNALHLHTPNIQQEDSLQQSAIMVHPLDSQYTTDVLRYVLEGYNALSWLALDSNTKDRLSCLPVHMQVLVQLYHTTAALL